MKTPLAILAALYLAASGPAVAGSATTRPILAPFNPHLGMHLVCQDKVQNHRQTKICIWVKNT